MKMRFYILVMLAVSVCRGYSETSEELFEEIRVAHDSEQTDIGKNGRFVAINKKALKKKKFRIKLPDGPVVRVKLKRKDYVN